MLHTCAKLPLREGAGRTDVLHEAGLLQLAHHLLGGVGEDDVDVRRPVRPDVVKPAGDNSTQVGTFFEMNSL